jgi:hypothetical protein
VPSADPEYDAAAQLRDCYCGVVDHEICFGLETEPDVPTGLCKSEIQALAERTNPLQIGIRYFALNDQDKPSNALSAMNQMFLCQKNNCTAECADHFDGN